MNPEFNASVEPETTGRFIVTCRKHAHDEGLAMLAKRAPAFGMLT